jgi:hypothetical protein
VHLRFRSLGLLSAAVALLAACASATHQSTSLGSAAGVLDSAKAAQMAIAAVADSSDSLVYYTVAAVVEYHEGYLVTVAPATRPQYVRRPDGSRLVVMDGDISVWVRRDGHAKVLPDINKPVRDQP